MVRPNVDVDYYDRDVVFARRSNTGWSAMRDRVSALVMLGHQMVEQAHAPARPPALVDFVLRRAERGAGDIEMRPGRLADETRQKLRRRVGAAVTAHLFKGQHPPMTVYMSSMPPAGLLDTPPVTKKKPLPMNAAGDAPLLPPFHRMMPVRLSCLEPWPTPSSAPMPSRFIAPTSSTSTTTSSLRNRAARRANSSG